MTQASSANWEIAIMLPLGVVDRQLQKIEEQLRALNMKALEFEKEHENTALRRLIETRLEHINELLGSIAGLVSDINADIQPTREVRQPRDGVDSGYSMGKSYPDQDD